MSITFNADEIFEMAEQIERNGAAFYREAAGITSDADVKEMLLSLAAMEEGHQKTFAQIAIVCIFAQYPDCVKLGCGVIRLFAKHGLYIAPGETSLDPFLSKNGTFLYWTVRIKFPRSHIRIISCTTLAFSSMTRNQIGGRQKSVDGVEDSVIAQNGLILSNVFHTKRVLRWTIHCCPLSVP